MRTRLAVLAAIALSVSLAGCGDDEPSGAATTTTTAAASTTTAATTTTTAPAPTTPAGQVISVTVSGGTVTPPPAAVDVKLGTTVTIEVTTDVADELHVHGYDRTLDLTAGAPGRLELPATIPGQFEVELHGDHLLLFTLRVS